MSECFGNTWMLDGKYFPCNEFRDEQVTRGTSFYEVIRVTGGKCMFLEDHLGRMKNSLSLSGKEKAFDAKIIQEYISDFLTKTSLKEGNIKLVYHFYGSSAAVYLYRIAHKYPEMDEYTRGVDIGLFFARRENPNIKYIDADLRNRINEEIKKTGVYEVLLVNENHCITEGSRSNIFFIQDEVVITAPDEEVLPGITRMHVIQAIKNLDIRLDYRKISADDLNKFDAAFITGTSPKVLPVKKAGVFNFDVNNKTMRLIMKAFDELVNRS